jgi:6-phosphogluconolactonase
MAMAGSTDPRAGVPAWHEYADADSLASGVADALAVACIEALNARDMVWLALAGGRTPLPAYRRLAEMGRGRVAGRDPPSANPVMDRDPSDTVLTAGQDPPSVRSAHAPAIDWGRVVAVPTDERCVPFDHPACNGRELAEAFAAASGLSLLPLTRPDGNPEASEALARRELNARAQPFDAVVLGMGADAHTASLFPRASQLAAALDPLAPFDALRIDPDPLPPEAPFARITLTAARLLRAHELHVVVSGNAKRAVLARALASDDLHAHPIAIVRRVAPDTRVHLHWSP